MEKDTPAEKQVVQIHPLLAGCLAKIERADEHISNLNAEISAFLNQDIYTISTKPEGEHTAVLVVNGPKPPIRFGVLVGEVIHQLRSILDHVVCAFVLNAGKEITTSHAFPVCDLPKKFEAARYQGRMQHVPPKAVALIEAIQPYGHPGKPVNHWLMALHNLDISDKHKVLVVVAAATSGLTYFKAEDEDGGQITGEMHFPKALIGSGEEGTEVVSITFSDKTPVKVEAKPALQIAFQEVGTTKGELVIPFLVQARDNIFRVLAAFDPILKNPK
jgi:hypothetical protein